MNWDQVGALAELLGAAAVVVSLAYVATQVKAVREQTRVATLQSLLDRSIGQLDQISTNKATADLYARGLPNLDALHDDGERVQFSLILLSILRNYEQMYYSERAGLLDEWIGPAYEKMYVDLFSSPGFRTWWSRRRHWFSGDFQTHVETLVGRRAESRPVVALRPDSEGAQGP